MPQGKMKVKTQLPGNVKGKKIKKLDKAPPKRKYKSKDTKSIAQFFTGK